MERAERKKNCVRADNGKERLWLREGREGRKGSVRSRVLSGTGQVQPSVVASPSLMTVPVLAAQVLPTRARGSQHKRLRPGPSSSCCLFSTAVCWRL